MKFDIQVDLEVDLEVDLDRQGFMGQCRRKHGSVLSSL